MSISEAQHYLLRAIEAFRNRIIVVSPELRILAANRHATRPDDGDWLGRQCHEVLFGRESSCPGCPAEEVKKYHRPTYSAPRSGFLQADRLACLLSYPLYRNGQIDAIAVMDFEMQSLDWAESYLQRANAFLKDLIRSAVDGIIGADMTGRIVIFNNAATEVSGYTVEEALGGMNIRSFYPGDGAREVMQKLRSDEYGGKGKLKKYHVEILGKNGEHIPISLYASIIYEGKLEVATIGFFHDLRERIQLKKDLAKAQVQVMQSEKMASLGKLAAGVAHQLNNPLGTITLFTKLAMEEYALPTGARDDLQRILGEAQRCRDTVRELLEFARQTRQFMQATDINRAVARTLFLLENGTLFQNIVIEKDLAPGLPPVHADVQQLNHMLMNIILNAAQAMAGRGTLTVRTSLQTESGMVVIQIADTGPGIPTQIIPQIFEPFFTTKEEGQGTGLGLSMAYAIVENHHGRIAVRNVEPHGAIFTVELQAKPATASEEVADGKPA